MILNDINQYFHIFSFQESTSLKSCLSKVKASDIIRYHQISSDNIKSNIKYQIWVSNIFISNSKSNIIRSCSNRPHPHPHPHPPLAHPPALGSSDPRSLDLLKQLCDLPQKWRAADVRDVPVPCHLEGETPGGSEVQVGFRIWSTLWWTYKSYGKWP